MRHYQIRACFWVGLVTACLGAIGCSSSSQNEEVTQALSQSGDSVKVLEGQVPDEESKRKMLAAKDILFTKLSGRLMETMSDQGPVAAIAVCQEEAPNIAKDVSEANGLKIGRTGVRLRNASNTAPPWAVPLIEEKTDVPTFVMLDNGHAAGLLPIKLQAQCLMCHGPHDQIAPEVKNQLQRLYPNDQATGFQEGELRGWFWIELAGH